MVSHSNVQASSLLQIQVVTLILTVISAVTSGSLVATFHLLLILLLISSSYLGLVSMVLVPTIVVRIKVSHAGEVPRIQVLGRVNGVMRVPHLLACGFLGSLMLQHA